MADFAKSIFGFAQRGRADPSDEAAQAQAQAQGQSHGQPQAQLHAQPHTGVSGPNTQSQTPISLLPRDISSFSATPTTAISNNASVYATTNQNAAPTLQSILKRIDEPPSRGPTYPVRPYADHGQPIIINTDEKGQPVGVLLRNSQPKGKLTVSITETDSIDAIQPYAVFTFESSEYVSHAQSLLLPHPALHFTNQLNHAPPQPHHRHHVLGRPLYQKLSSTQHLTALANTGASAQNNARAPPKQALAHRGTPAVGSDLAANFDVVGQNSELDISLYDAGRDDIYLGHVRLLPGTTSNNVSLLAWLDLKARFEGEQVCPGRIKVGWEYLYVDSKRTYGPDDFEVLRLLGKGTFGQVFQVRKKDVDRIYAMKVLSKKVIVKKKEIAHTIGERNILVRTLAAASPFIVGLKFSFQTPTDLYLVTDYMLGGELFWHLQKEGRFSEDRARFYIAELILALEHLHDNDIVYRDLKPENILLDANGHIALCDFGLSKANLNNDGTTNTFCGTTEYLAPEVLLDELGYTKMVDFWLLGVLIFEMCCGWLPFYADNTQQMYKNIAFGKVRFPKEVLLAEGRLFVKGLLNRNPKHRLGATNDARELRAHPFFADIDWALLRARLVPPPFKPHLSLETDTLNFDPEFTLELTALLRRQMDISGLTPLSPGIQANFKGFTYVDDSAMEDHFGKSHRINTYRNPGLFIPGNPNLPADEDVIDDDMDDIEDEMDIDREDAAEDDDFVNGRFDL